MPQAVQPATDCASGVFNDDGPRAIASLRQTTQIGVFNTIVPQAVQPAAELREWTNSMAIRSAADWRVIFNVVAPNFAAGWTACGTIFRRHDLQIARFTQPTVRVA